MKIGVEYLGYGLQADIRKSELKLEGKRDRLWIEGYDIVKAQNRGFKL